MDQPSEAHPTPTTLYRLYAPDGRLLYIGIAGNPGRRFEQHRGEKAWWGEVSDIKLEHHPSRSAALAHEAAAIRAENPAYNQQFSAATMAIGGRSMETDLLPDGRRGLDVAAEMGISRTLYAHRRYGGWDIEEAATTPVRERVVLRSGDTWGEWTVVSRKGSDLVLRHGCGAERSVDIAYIRRVGDCIPCWRKGLGLSA